MIDDTELAWRAYKAEYSRRWAATDHGKAVRQAYRQRTRDAERDRLRRKYAEDPMYRAKRQAANRRYYARKVGKSS